MHPNFVLVLLQNLSDLTLMHLSWRMLQSSFLISFLFVYVCFYVQNYYNINNYCNLVCKSKAVQQIRAFELVFFRIAPGQVPLCTNDF